ncbi:MAG: ACT domain-containing protein, partial [Nitrososphaerota archaeon]|nr:ACT domain-containing protein [Nitrososphaerota archaeon]
GFVARCEGRMVVLGRGGSDVTATVLGNCLDADEVVLVKDTSGIMSADPDIVREARPIPSLSINELYALAHGGAKVVRPEALFYKTAKQRLRIVEFGRPLGEDGTEVAGVMDATAPHVESGGGLQEITVLTDGGLSRLGRILEVIGEGVRGVGTAKSTVSVFVQGQDWQDLCRRIHGLDGVRAVSGRRGVGYVDIGHPHLVDRPGMVARAATILSLHHINITEVTSSKGGLTFYVDEKFLERASSLLEENLVV